MTISLSIRRIAESIYARSALDAATRGIDVPAALTRRNKAALHRLIADKALETIASLGNGVENISEGDELISFDYAVGHHEAEAVCLRTNIEANIVCSVLAQVSAAINIDLAQWYSSLVKASAGSLPKRIERSA